MAWTNAVITNRGLEMLRQAIDGGQMMIVSASGSDKTYPAASLMVQTAPANEKQTFSITEIKDVDNGKRIRVTITNEGLTTGYVMKQLCLWARTSDVESPQIIAILQDEVGTTVHAESEIASYLMQFYVLLKVDTAANMKITINDTAFTTFEDFNSHVNDAAKHVTSTERTAWNNKAETSDLFSKSYDDLKNIPSRFTPKEHSHSFKDIKEKPSSYPPSPHSHPYIPTFQKGIPGGVAALNENGKVDEAENANTVDGYKLDQDVRSSASPTFACINAPSLENFKTNGNLSNKVIIPDPIQIAQSPIAGFVWHDILAFCKIVKPVFEKSSNGTSWVPSNLCKDLFAQKENQEFLCLEASTTKSVRWTWHSSELGWSGIQWMILGFTYVANHPNVTVTIQKSSDGSDWYDVHKSTRTYDEKPAWFYLDGIGGNYYLRLIITHNSGGDVRLCTIRALTQRWGGQGQGSEFSLPYTWDASQYMFVKAPPGNSNSNLIATTAFVNAMLNKIAANKDTATNGQVLTSNGDGTGQFKKLDIPQKYVHPSEAGYKHIPSGGSSGQFLAWGGSSGTAKWEDIQTTKYLVDEKGNKYVKFVQGYNDQNDSWASPEDFPMDIRSNDDDGENSLVTDEVIDLSDYNSLSASFWGRSGEGGTVYLVVASSKMSSYTTYSKRASDHMSTWDVTMSVPINDLSGKYFIRIHIRGDQSLSVKELKLLK